jgi:hypothetical protein
LEYTIFVRVEADDQHKAFHFVETALSDYVEKHEDLVQPETIHLSTPDGTHSTSF